MFDSTAPWAIPRDAGMVAYYVDGIYAWPPEWLDLFPSAVKVSISAIGRTTAQVGDVEVGCIWPPADAVPWVRRARAEGYDPTIYVNQRNDWGPTVQAFRDAGEPEPHWWVANYDGVREVPSGAVAKQFAHPGDGGAPVPWETGAHYDLSIVADYWPGVDAPPSSGGGGAGRELDVGTHLLRGRDTGRCFIVDVSTGTRAKWHIPNTEVLGVLAGLMGTTARDVDDALLDYIGDASGPPAVELTDTDRSEIAAKIRLGLLDDLAPLFELAARLKD
jgi:hypothetical protein